MMKKKLFILILFALISSNSYSQKSAAKTDSIHATYGIKIGSNDVSTFLKDYIVANKLLAAALGDSIVGTVNLSTLLYDYLGSTDAVGDSQITKRKLSSAVYDYINAAGGGTITNSPDDYTIGSNASNELYVKENVMGYTYLDTTSVFKFPSGITIPSGNNYGVQTQGSIYGTLTLGTISGFYGYSLLGEGGRVDQTGTLSGANTKSAMSVLRNFTLNGNTAIGPVLWVKDFSGSTGDLIGAYDASSKMFSVSYDGTGQFYKGIILDSNAPSSTNGALKYTGSDIEGYVGGAWWSMTNAERIVGKPVSLVAPTAGYVLQYNSGTDSLQWVANTSIPGQWSESYNSVFPYVSGDSVAIGWGDAFNASGIDSAETWLHIASTNASAAEHFILLENKGTTTGTGAGIGFKTRNSDSDYKYSYLYGWDFDAASGGNIGWKLKGTGSGTLYDMFNFYHNGSAIVFQGNQTSFLIKDASGDTRLSLNDAGDLTLSDMVTDEIKFTTSPAVDKIMISDATGNASWKTITSLAGDSIGLGDLNNVLSTGWANGSVMYYNGTNWVNLGVGANGLVIKSNGTIPGWDTDATGGGGSATADSASTADGNWDFDLFLDASGEIDTTTINDAQWQTFVANHSALPSIVDISSETNLKAGGGIVLSNDSLYHSTAAPYKHIPSSGASAQILQYNASGTAKWITLSADATIADGGAISIVNDSHSHTGASLSGIDISDDTNLSAAAPATLTGDVVGVDTTDATNAALATQWDITNIDLSDDVNLTVTAPVTLTGDAVGVDTTDGNANLSTQYDDLVLRNAFEKGHIYKTLINPDSLSFPGSKFKIWSNGHGSDVTIDSIKCVTDKTTQNYLVTFQETAEYDSTTANLIDAVTVGSSGTGVYYKKETTISHATIENTNEIWIKYDTSKDIKWLTVEIFYHW